MTNSHLKSDLQLAVESWDGKSRAAIQAVHDQFHDLPNWTDALIDLSAIKETERGATWLLKNELDTANAQWSTAQCSRFYGLANSFHHWEARLHMFQCMERAPIDQKQIPSVFAMVKRNIGARERIVRAWAYYCIALFASTAPEYRDEAVKILQRAKNVETAGSIKVRLRKAHELLQINSD